MSGESKKQPVELPDRKEISLCEAVTAVVFGEALNVEQYQSRQPQPESESLEDFFDLCTPAHELIPLRNETPANEIDRGNQTPANERLTKTAHLLEALRQAAYAERLKVRGIKDYANPADGRKDVDPAYFYYRVAFNWSQDEMHLDDESSTVWSCVHLDRQELVSCLRELGISVQESAASVAQSKDAEAPRKQKTYKTGDPGRPTSRHLYFPEAERRLAAEDHPETIKAFAEELAEWLQITEPQAAPTTPSAIRNRVRSLWRTHEKVCTK
jgi:hypothetical protein